MSPLKRLEEIFEKLKVYVFLTASDMEGDEAPLEVTLDACSAFHLAEETQEIEPFFLQVPKNNVEMGSVWSKELEPKVKITYPQARNRCLGSNSRKPNEPIKTPKLSCE